MTDTLAQVIGDGEAIEVRCTREGCPHPLIGRYLAAVHAAHGSEGDEMAHRVRVHEIPDVFELPPGLVAAWEGIRPGI
jgi:hypothetical protein